MSDLMEFLRARFDEEAEAAEAARRQIAERACPPPQVEEFTARAGHWGVVPWLFSGRVEADLAHWGRVEIATVAKEHIALHDPARVLAEVEAKREVVRLAERAHDYHETFMNGFAAAMEQALRLYALPHADHPDYREEWRP